MTYVEELYDLIEVNIEGVTWADGQMARGIMLRISRARGVRG